MKGNQDEVQIQYQPPGAAELVRHPPANSVCARFRGMLRDYADQDLSPATREAVDEHLHTCRDCSLALSRAELEVMRIAAALTGRRPGEERGPVGPAKPPQVFTDTVVARLQERPAADVPPRSHRWWILLPSAALLAVGLRLSDGWNQDQTAQVVRILGAVDATWSEAGQARPINPGQSQPDGILTVGPRGNAELAWTPHGPQLGTQFQIEGDSRLQIAETATLHYGAMTVQTTESQIVQVPGARPIHLGVGRYHISAIASDRYDSSLTAESLTRVRLEVLDGQPADVTSALGTQRRQVHRGEVADYDGWSPLLVDRALSEQRLATALRGRTATTLTATPRPGLWLGRLVGPDGLAVANVSVDVISPFGLQTVYTDLQGRFQVTSLEQHRGTDVALKVLLPRGPGVALYGPAPKTVFDNADPDGLLLGSVQLQPERPASGRVRDEDFHGVSGAHIVPLLVDELLGLVQPLWKLATWSGSDGEFALHRLPPSLEAHTSLVLLVDHVDYPPSLSHALAGIPASDHDRLLDVVLEAGVQRELRNLDPGQTVDVAFELPGLPDPGFSNPGMVWVELVADDTGTATLHVPAEGRQWVSIPRRANLAPLVIDTDRVLRPDTNVEVSRPAGPVGSRDVSGRVRLPADHRYGQFRRTGESRIVVLSVVDAQTGIARRNARLFLVPTDSPPVYLGDYDGVTGFSAPLPASETARVLALGPEGSIGFLDVVPGSPGQLLLRTQSPGRLTLDEISRPTPQEPRTLELKFRALDGELQGTVFTRLVERDHDWSLSGLLPGLYQVVDGHGGTSRCRIEPGQQTTLTLSR